MAIFLLNKIKVVIKFQKYYNVRAMVGTKIESDIGTLEIKELLGKGKSGYSYLSECLDKQYIYKLMHYERCDYYHFGDSNKVELELTAYKKLLNLNIKIPKLLCYNIEKNYLVKEYISGETAASLILTDRFDDSLIYQLFEISAKAQKQNINLDYYPANFVVNQDCLYYIDYETNPYHESWSLLTWGLHYWADKNNIDNSGEIGIPDKKITDKIVKLWTEKMNLSNISSEDVT